MYKQDDKTPSSVHEWNTLFSNKHHRLYLHVWLKIFFKCSISWRFTDAKTWIFTHFVRFGLDLSKLRNCSTKCAKICTIGHLKMEPFVRINLLADDQIIRKIAKVSTLKGRQLFPCGTPLSRSTNIQTVLLESPQKTFDLSTEDCLLRKLV